jgi:hypothetical protein
VNQSDIMEVELLNYWLSMRKLNALFRQNVAAPDDIDDTKAELEAISMYTPWPLLRTRCLAAIHEARLAADVA